MARKLRIGVVFGGRSGEHEVSVASARAVLAAIDRSQYDVVPIAIARSGQWLPGVEPLALSAPGDATTDLSAGSDGTPAVGIAALPATAGGDSPSLDVDVIFPVLHGTYGEDGALQGLLEMAGLAYVGCGVLGSALGMDKDKAKMLFQAAGLPVVPWIALARHTIETAPAEAIAAVEERFAYPVFVKPANLGSSVGVSKARDRDGLRAALAKAARYDRRVIVECAIDCRELECAVLGNDDPQASVVGEIVPSNEFYDYRAKYLDGQSRIIIPAPIEPEMSERVRTLAVAAFRALDLSGLARVDFFLDRSNGVVWLNEVNTMPGFTEISMYPKLWEASGLPFPALIDRLIALALERHADRACNATDVDL
jgi:D-alanine-D-alanine ligase